MFANASSPVAWRACRAVNSSETGIAYIVTLDNHVTSNENMVTETLIIDITEAKF